MYTLSKTYNMAGWRVGFAVGNSTIIEAINLIQDHLYVSLFPAVQKAAIAALSDDQSYFFFFFFFKKKKKKKKKKKFFILCRGACSTLLEPLEMPLLQLVEVLDGMQ